MEIEYQNMKIKICERTLKIEIRYNETFWKTDHHITILYRNKQKYYLMRPILLTTISGKMHIGIGMILTFRDLVILKKL